MALAIHLSFEAFWRRPEALSWIRELCDRFESPAGSNRAALLGAAGFASWVMFDVSAGVDLAERALAADTGPAGSIDCLPENAAVGAYVYSGRLDDANRVCDRALAVLAGDPTRRFDYGYEHAARAAYMATFGLTDNSTYTSAKLAVRAGRSAGNPTLTAYGQLALGLAHGLTNRPEAIRLLELARETAGTVDNHWLVNTASLALVMGQSTLDVDDRPLDALLDLAREFHRVGWPTHAWGPIWAAIPILWRDGRHDDAAAVLGACTTSGLNPVVDSATALPGELQELVDRQPIFDPDPVSASTSPLDLMFSAGRNMSVPEVVRLIDR